MYRCTRWASRREPDRGAYWFAPEEIGEACEVFGTRSGLPIYFAEFWYTSDPARKITGGYRQSQWSSERQAEAIEEFYRVAFGHPAVEAIIYLGLNDADPPGYPKVCLLDEQYRPKPAPTLNARGRAGMSSCRAPRTAHPRVDWFRFGCK